MQAEMTVVSQKEVAPLHYEMVLSHPEIARAAKPGQFVHIRCGRQLSPLLRRPISIHDINAEAGQITILYRVVGEGTRILSQTVPGQALDVLGPLGHGFSWSAEAKHLVFIGGGIGVAPLYAAAKAAVEEGKQVTFLLGAAKKEQLLCCAELENLGVKLNICTDDGSVGFQGNTAQLLAEVMKKEIPDYIGACGPMPMLKAVAAKAGDIECQVSLEEKMACGIGACLGCVCKTEHEGQELFSKVCSAGPVFAAKKVKWNG